MQKTSSFPELFKPGSIGKMELKNRIVMPPMVRNWATADGAITDRLLEHFAEVARGGVGFIIIEASYIEPRGKGFANEIGLYDDKLIPGLKKLVETVHDNGAKIAMQVYHAGRQTVSQVTGTQPVAPSPIPCPVEQEMPRELTTKEVEELVEAYAEGARRAKDAGFDAVEIHGTHGYLINQFLSPYSNKRTDKYGGSLEGRMRFALEIVERTREKVGKAFPIIFRLSGDEYVEGGLSIEDTKVIAQRLEKTGVDALHVSAGVYESTIKKGVIIQPMALPRGCLVHLAEGIKKVVRIPVITVGRINNPELAESILREKKADFIAMGRALLADPELPKKAQEGRVDDIRMCTACCQGCIDRLFMQQDITCLVNPAVGREKEFALKPAEKAKKVLVIGGGPAGMEAARVAVLRGHKVTLYEKSDKLGGQLILAATPPYKGEFSNLNAYLSTQMEKLDVKVELGKEVTPAMVQELQPDVVIAAVGSQPLIPEGILGIGGDNVVTAWDVLAGKVDTKGTVIVAGGGMVGCETAEFLAEKGKKVNVVEMLPDIAMDVGVTPRVIFIQRLAEHKIEMLTNRKIKEIAKNGVIVEQDGKTQTIEGDTVVLALGAVPERKLIESLRGKVAELREIGDCVEARKALDAVYEGSRVAREI
jgi:2,4-dienoyl-CoA reductase-like NADH-dependent reductase (Old Yellow Enzyme family)/thioredoxin reductase